MVALSGYRLGRAVLAIPGALAIITLLVLRRAVPDTRAYENAGADQPGSAQPGGVSSDATAATAGGWRFSGRFWGYAGFTALTMLGYATFGVLGYHLQVRHVVPEWQIPVIYAAAMGIDALAALGPGWVYDRFGLRGLGMRGTGYGAFTAVYGLAWLGGGAIIGALYDASMTALGIFVVATQAAALAAFVPMAGRHATS